MPRSGSGIVTRGSLRLTLAARLAVAVACLVAPGCSDSSSGPSAVVTAQGTWTGEYTVSACNDQTAPGFCGGFVPVGTALPIQLVLTQSGQQLSGTANLAAFSVPVSGTINAGGRIVLNGSATVAVSGLSTTVTVSNWDTVVSGSNMTGTWRTTFTIAGIPGSASIDSTIRTVTKTG